MKYRHFKKSRKQVGSRLFCMDQEGTPASERHQRYLYSRWGGRYLWRWRGEQWARGKKEDEA